MSRVALVTGGSGAVGSSIVRRLAATGDRVAFTYLNNAASAETLAADVGAIPFRVDLTSAPHVAETIENVIRSVGDIDVLVNNAGKTQVLPFALIEESDWDDMFVSNMKSMFLVTHAVVRCMIRKKSGSIVNIGSLAGHRLLEVPVHYAAAKSAVTGFTLSLAKELSRYHIRVNEVVPGLLSGGIGNNIPPRALDDYNRFCSQSRPGRADEVADLVAFLASDHASYINAQSVFIDGGI